MNPSLAPGEKAPEFFKFGGKIISTSGLPDKQNSSNMFKFTQQPDKKRKLDSFKPPSTDVVLEERKSSKKLRVSCEREERRCVGFEQVAYLFESEYRG